MIIVSSLEHIFTSKNSLNTLKIKNNLLFTFYFLYITFYLLFFVCFLFLFVFRLFFVDGVARVSKVYRFAQTPSGSP